MGGALIEIHVISDSTGDTAARVARAAAAQFMSHQAVIIKHPRVSSAESVAALFDKITESGRAGMTLFSTVVDDGLRAQVVERCEALRIPHCDLLGPAIAALEQVSGDRAERVVARPVGVDADYFARIAAMEYAVKHDDGQHPEGLTKADIVLVGVSRTGKTPLSMYLGYLGYRTANVPLVAQIAPPAQLFDCDRTRVVALTIDPRRLATIRSRRVSSIAPADGAGDYAELPAIFDEMDQARKIQRALGCPIVDTTTLALEEAARRVIELVESRRPGAPPGTIGSHSES